MSEICTFPADPDIAGIGVLLSFFVSVTLSFLLAVYGFYFIKGSYVPDQLTTLDIVPAGPVNTLIENLFHDHKPLITREVFREVILLFSDQQLINGLAILTVAFCRFESITQYHFAVASCLANMALVVQFIASDILGEFLGQRPEMIWWRASAFVTLAVLSTLTLISCNSKYFLRSFGSEMACLWNKSSGNHAVRLAPDTVVYMILSLWGIIDVLGQYFPVITDNRLFRGVETWIVGCLLLPRRYYIRMEQSANASIARIILRAALRGLAFCIFVISEILGSEALELIRNWAMLLANVIEVYSLRYTASKNGRQGNEDTWEFGQAVPMFMLILPLCTLFELYWITKNKFLHDQQDDAERPQLDDEAASMTTTIASSGDSFSSRQRLCALLFEGSHVSSSSLGHTRVAAPELSIAAGTNPGNYYFSCPAAKMGPTDLEDQIYSCLWFRVLLRLFMTGLFVGLTALACLGYAV
ncbi:hypothetical protein M409DRAFT_27605 [Zasmidium cellare ATCC 36951]|uniref:Uncharacterized protein n=1 Tax=Zasmidium cellare ATCC 36951 TaxID=1080233 RepID=A0A6A6C3Z9_ZASCE|nr:uncharacterized protein M409DRAFT_27605 [Zasmidium cellare ATCC 36951]KAF2161877.1 hypothetical protein M409DRAFT_27605 [Zasmidium cellare ATCC 36951]